MFNNVFRDKKNERFALLLAVLMFGFIALLQLWRVFTGATVLLDGHTIPIWISALVGIAALLMSVWMGAILRHNRPLL